VGRGLDLWTSIETISTWPGVVADNQVATVTSSTLASLRVSKHHLVATGCLTPFILKHIHTI